VKKSTTKGDDTDNEVIGRTPFRVHLETISLKRRGNNVYVKLHYQCHLLLVIPLLSPVFIHLHQSKIYAKPIDRELLYPPVCRKHTTERFSIHPFHL